MRGKKAECTYCCQLRLAGVERESVGYLRRAGVLIGGSFLSLVDHPHLL